VSSRLAFFLKGVLIFRLCEQRHGLVVGPLEVR